MANSKAIQTISSNIEVLRRRLEVSEEQMTLSLKQLVHTLCAGAGEMSIESAYSEFGRLSDTPTHKALFCRYICAERRFASSAQMKNPFGSGEGALPGTHGKIAYVRNRRGDDAFAHFSSSRRASKVHYVSSFVEACEAVWENTAEFCVIPIENNTAGRLYSFYAMLDRYELKICAVAQIEDGDGVNHTTFALAGRNVDFDPSKSTRRRFEFSVIHEDADFIGDIINVCGALGGRLYSVGTQPLPYDDVRNKYFFAVDFDVTSPVPLALYLGLEYPRYAPIGLYNLKI